MNNENENIKIEGAGQLLKGEFNGNCNRAACQKPPAEYYNYSTEKWYCKDCSELLNLVNRPDAMRLFGHDLCLHYTEVNEKKEMIENMNKVFDATPTYSVTNIRPVYDPENKMNGQISERVRTEPKYRRNDACHCGSGKKYKNCCIN